MDIFLSYSSAQLDIAHRLALSLEGEGHTVFFDRSDIDEGGAYDAKIRTAIEAADLFVFLLSPESVAPGSYPLAELRIAEKAWEHPAGRVLPVLAAPVPIDAIPPYLRAVSILKPRGDLVAEASAAVARMTRRPRTRALVAILAVGVLVAFAAWAGYSRFAQNRARQQDIGSLLSAAALENDAGRYESAFRSLAQGRTRFPEERSLRQAQEHAAMLWLRKIVVRVGERTFADVVDEVRPVLTAGVQETSGAEKAALLAHLGWSEYLLAREGTAGQPEVYFQRAVEADAPNAYAHAMWGFWILSQAGPLDKAAAHFETAAASEQDRPWTRNLQIAGLLFRSVPSLEVEAVRIANRMRLENVAVEDPARLWNVYQYRLISGFETEALLGALAPADNLLTFQWLFPEGTVRPDRLHLYRFMLARLEEAAGNRDRAREAYAKLEQELKDSPGSLLDRTREGIRRLSK